MNAFVALPMLVFTALMVGLLVELFRGLEEPVPRQAGVTWAVSMPVAGLLAAVGLGLLAIPAAVVSVLALGSLAWWFLVPEGEDSDDDAEERLDPDPGPSDDAVLDVPREAEPELEIDWDAFDRARAGWELAPLPERV